VTVPASNRDAPPRVTTSAVVQRVFAGLLALVLGPAACRSGVCPTIGCGPKITLAYQQPIVAPYHVLVSLRGVTFEADCLMEPSFSTIGIQSCSTAGVVVSGVDLGDGANETVDLTVTLDGAQTLAVTAMLDGITNSRDCDLVCYRHSGTVPN
jgi:hypothetical protein